LGYLTICCAWFGFKAVQYSMMETATGVVTRIVGVGFKVSGPRGGNSDTDGKYQGVYLCPEVHFKYQSSTANEEKMYTVQPQALSMHKYKAGESTTVIFPKNAPEKATLYTHGEFWLPTYMLVILLAASLFWTIGFVIVVFKPWK
jgi:Protein of unknown function (DUF3592)